MSTRVVLHLDNDDLADAVMQVLLALKDYWGEKHTADTLKRIEVSRP